MIWLMIGGILCVWAILSVLGGEMQHLSRRSANEPASISPSVAREATASE